MWTTKLVVVLLAIAITVRAKPLDKEDAASEIKEIKDELNEIKDHPEDPKKDEKIDALIDEIKELKDDLVEEKADVKEKADTVEEKADVVEEKADVVEEKADVIEEVENDEDVEKEDVAEDNIASYKQEIARMREVLADPATAKNPELMQLISDQAKHLKDRVEHDQEVAEDAESKKDEAVPEEIIHPTKDEVIEIEEDAKAPAEIVHPTKDEVIEIEEDAEAPEAPVNAQDQINNKLKQIHDHLETVKTALEEKTKDAQIDGPVLDDEKMNVIKQKLHDVRDRLVHVRDQLENKETVEVSDEVVKPEVTEPKQVIAHDVLVHIKEKLSDIKTHLAENPITDENVKREVVEKLHDIKTKLKDMAIDEEASEEVYDEGVQPELPEAPVAPVAPVSAKDMLAESVTRIKSKLLHLKEELKDNPITDENVKKDVAAKLHLVHEKLADVAASMTIEDAPEDHPQNELADHLHQIKEKLLDVKAKLLADPITDEAERQAVKNGLEKIHEKLADFADKINVEKIIAEDEKKDSVPNPIHIIKGKIEKIRDEIKENPEILEDPAVKRVVEEKLKKIRAGLNDYIARSGAKAMINDVPAVTEKKEVPLKLKLHDVKNRLIHLKDVLREHPIKDDAVRKDVEERLVHVKEKLQDMASEMRVDEADAPKEEEIAKPSPVADEHLHKLDLNLVKAKMDHIKEMLKDHPITDAAVKDEVREKLVHIQTELKDYVQALDNEEPMVTEVEEKKETAVESDADKIAKIHDKLDQIRKNLIAHPLKDESVKKAVIERVHIIKDRLEDYAEAHGYEEKLVKDETPVEKKEDAEPKDEGQDVEQEKYASLTARLTKIKDQLVAHPVKDESVRAEIESKLEKIKTKLIDMQDMQKKTEAEKVEVVGGPADEPASGPADVPAGGPADEPVDGPADVPAGGPADVPAGGPADEPVDGPADVPDKKPIKLPAIEEDEKKADELEAHLAHLKDEMAKLKKDYAALKEDKALKDEKETEKSAESAEAASDSVVTEWEAELADEEAELDAVHQ